MKSKLLILSGLVLSIAPAVALAQVTGGSNAPCTPPPGVVEQNTLFFLLCRTGELLSAVLPILIALGVVLFVWGVITYVVGSDEEAKKKGRDRIIYGIIGLAVIIGLWGLVKILTNTFGLDNVETITYPTVPF